MSDSVRNNVTTPVAEKPNPEPILSADAVEERLVRIGEWLVKGAARSSAVTTAMTVFGVGRRAAQRYVHDAMQRLAWEGAQEHRLYQLRVSQQQREWLVTLAIGAVEHAGEGEKLDNRGLAALINAANKALDGRDRAAAEIHELLGYKTPLPRHDHERVPEPEAAAPAAQDPAAESPATRETRPENVARRSAPSPQVTAPKAHPDSHHLENVARPGDAPGALRSHPAAGEPVEGRGSVSGRARPNRLAHGQPGSEEHVSRPPTADSR